MSLLTYEPTIVTGYDALSRHPSTITKIITSSQKKIYINHFLLHGTSAATDFISCCLPFAIDLSCIDRPWLISSRVDFSRHNWFYLALPPVRNWFYLALTVRNWVYLVLTSPAAIDFILHCLPSASWFYLALNVHDWFYLVLTSPATMDRISLCLPS